MIVTLTPQEVFLAAQTGLFRQISNLKNKRVHAHGFSGTGWSEHITGAIGELVVARALGSYWNGNLEDFSAGDVNNKIRIEVRTTNREKGRLICYEKDHDEAAFVLVTGEYREYKIKGWVWGHEAKNQKYWDDPGTGRPNYFVPQEKLSPFSELQQIINLG